MNYKDQSRNKIEMKKIIKKNNKIEMKKIIKKKIIKKNNRNEKGEDTTDTTEKIIRDYDKQLHANKKENLGESKKP